MKNLSLFTALLIIASQQCHAMENRAPISKQNILAELTTIKKPKSVVCFPNNSVAIAGNHGCSLFDLSTNKEFMKIDNINQVYIAAHPHKNLLAIRSNNVNLAVYDITTKNKIWETESENWHGGPIFNPIDDIVLIGNNAFNLDSFNYKNNSSKSYMLLSMNNIVQKSFHPTKQEFASCYSQKITIISLDQKDFIEESFSTKASFCTCRYSPDGSSIVSYDSLEGCCILNTDSGSRKPLDTSNRLIHAMALNSISFILASLSGEHGFIQYWNTKNRTLITATPITFQPDKLYCYDSLPFNHMAFSCDGTKLIVAVTDNCLVLAVPFEAQYKNLTKEKTMLICWLLKQYQLDQNNVLPHDIAQLIMHNLLAASKYSLTHY